MERDNYYSFCKGLAIIAVVIIHTGYSGYFSGLSVVFMRQPVTFAVGLFFFISGFFVSEKQASFSGAWGTTKRILIPYVIWSILWFIETTVKGTQPIDVWKIVNTTFFGGAFFPLYFLVVLIELKLLTPLLLKHVSNENYRLCRDWVLLVTPLTLLIYYYLQYSANEVPLIQEQIAPTWLIYYYLGILYKRGMIKLSSVFCVVGVLLGLYLMNFESSYIMQKTNLVVFAVSMVKYSSVFYTIFLCILLMNCHQEMGKNLFVKLGEYSFGIFLLHIPIKKYLVEYPFSLIGFDGPLFQPVTIVTTLFLSYTIVRWLNKILPYKVCRYFGLS